MKSSLKFLVMVNTSPWGSSRSGVALRFLRATLEAGHEVSALYFRGDGVYHAMPGRQADPGATDLSKGYASLAQSGQFQLLLCSAALSRRFEASADTFQAPWQAAGLARWVELLGESDRVVSF